MALNPPISLSGIPLRLDGEFLMLERKHIEAEFKIAGLGKKTGKGKLYITTARMVFVHGDYAKSDFKSFDIPLLSLKKEKFEQPIFGSNYLSGTVAPIYGLLPGETTFKLWFTSGGCQTFLNCFCKILEEIRRGQQSGPGQKFIDQVRLGQFSGQKGFVDPNDPSIIYVSQPAETYSNVLNNAGNNQNFYGQNYQDPNFNYKGQGVAVGSNNPDIQKQFLGQNQPSAQNNNNQPPVIATNLNQPPTNYMSQQPNYNQPLANNYQIQPNYNQPTQNFNQPQPNYNYPQYVAPPQNYNQPNQDQYNQQYAPPREFLSDQQNPQNNNNNQQANEQQRPNMDVSYYYGFNFGPQLRKNY